MHCRKIQLKSGVTWACTEDAPANPTTGKRRQVERRASTKKEAKQKVLDAIKDLKENVIDKSIIRNITFGTTADEWLKVYEKTTGVKKGTIRIRQKEIKILKRFFVNTPIVNINYAMYQNMLLDLGKDAKKGEPYSENTISGVNTCAKMIFKFAKKNKIIKDNPCDDAKIPKSSITVEELENDTIEQKFFESHELDLFLDMVLKIGLKYDKEWFFTLAFSGMRPGEVIALKKQDLDFENNKIRISKTLINENNNMKKYEIETTKTSRVRIIDMDESIMRMLKKVVRDNNAHKMEYQTLIDEFHDEDFVFQRFNGYPFMTKSIGDRMRRIMKHLDINKHLTPHSLRHTHVSMLTELKNDLPTIMDRVGHRDPETTLKVYTHVTNKTKVKSIENLTSHHSDILKKITL